MREKNYLVSVFVITYNSSKYVVETLDSVKSQTYQNIELIISDDCSTDNTVELCQDWIEKNGDRFVNTIVLTVAQNTGISPNCNRAIKAANGEWVKGIAGDDLLMPNCIADNVKFVTQHPDVYVVQSENSYINEFSQPIIRKAKVKKRFKDERITAKEQHKLSLFTSNVNIQTLFIKKDLFNYIGEYDESIPMMEDRPFYLKATQQGFKIYYFPTVTTVYREHSESVMRKAIQKQIINNHLLTFIQVSEKYVYPNLSKFGLLIYEYYAFVMRRVFQSKFNSRNTFNILLWYVLKFPYSVYCRYKIFSINILIDISFKNHR